MQYVSMFLVGLIVGIVARWVYPGTVPMGLVMSAVLGIVGSFVAGFIGNLLQGNAEGKVQPAGFFYSVLGAVLVIFVVHRLGMA